MATFRIDPTHGRKDGNIWIHIEPEEGESFLGFPVFYIKGDRENRWELELRDKGFSLEFIERIEAELSKEAR